MVAIFVQSLRDQHALLCSSAAATLNASRRDPYHDVEALHQDERRAKAMIKKREEAIDSYEYRFISKDLIFDAETTVDAFKKDTILPLIKLFYQRDKSRPWEDSLSGFPRSDSCEAIARRDFAAGILSWKIEPNCLNNGVEGAPKKNQINRRSFAKPSMAWPTSILTVAHATGSKLTAEDWNAALDIALADLEYIPGPWSGRVSGRRFTRITTAVSRGTKHNRSPSEVIESVTKRQKLLPMVPFSVPFRQSDVPTALFIGGCRALGERYSTKKTPLNERLVGFFDQVLIMLNPQNLCHQVFMHAAYSLIMLRPLPKPEPWVSGEDPKKCLGLRLQKGCSPDEWAFCLLMACFMTMNEPQLYRSGLASITEVRTKILEHRNVSCRLLEILGFLVRKPGAQRVYPRPTDMQTQPITWYQRKIEEMKSASSVSANRYFRVWMDADHAENAVKTLMAHDEEEAHLLTDQEDDDEDE